MIYCSYCSIDIDNFASFQNNYAREGAVLYIKDASPTFISSTVFTSNTAMDKGGVASFYETLGSTNPHVDVTI